MEQEQLNFEFNQETLNKYKEIFYEGLELGDSEKIFLTFEVITYLHRQLITKELIKELVQAVEYSIDYYMQYEYRYEFIRKLLDLHKDLTHVRNRIKVCEQEEKMLEEYNQLRTKKL